MPICLIRDMKEMNAVLSLQIYHQELLTEYAPSK